MLSIESVIIIEMLARNYSLEYISNAVAGGFDFCCTACSIFVRLYNGLCNSSDIKRFSGVRSPKSSLKSLKMNFIRLLTLIGLTTADLISWNRHHAVSQKSSHSKVDQLTSYRDQLLLHLMRSGKHQEVRQFAKIIANNHTKSIRSEKLSRDKIYKVHQRRNSLH